MLHINNIPRISYVLCSLWFYQIAEKNSRGPEPRARVAVLFSGGIDSTMLAFLADQSVKLLTSHLLAADGQYQTCRSRRTHRPSQRCV